MSKKLIGIIASFALILSMVGGSVAQAAALNSSQISAIVALLQSFGADATTVANVTASLNGQPTSGTVSTPSSSGYTFATNLTIGSTGADVTALQQILVNDGHLVMPAGIAMGYFGALTKSAVIKYQLAKGITPAVGYVGSITRTSLNGSAGSTGGTTTVIPSGTDLRVALAPTSPVTGAIVAGQAIANLAEFTFTNTSAVPAVVTNVSLQRGGVSNDAVLTNVYLYNGVNRLTDSASISSGKISFNAPSGLFTVPAGSSMTVAVRSDIVSGTSYNGQIIVLSLLDAHATIPVSVQAPVSGAAQTVSSANLATVTFSASSTPTTSSIDPQTDFVMWQQTLTVATNDSWLKSLALRQIGSVASNDLGNFKLYMDGLQVGATLNTLDANGYLTFDLSASPVKMIAGSHTLKLVGDIIGGSTRTFSFSLRQSSDINIVDSQLNVNVSAVTGDGASFSNNDTTTGTISVNSGTISIAKMTASPSGNVTLTAPGVSLAKFEIKAAGEPMKVENLYVRIAPSIVTVGSVRNGALYANGSQIGNTADISSSTTGTLFNLGSNLIVYPGTPVTLEVRGDIYDNTGTQNFVNGTTLSVSLVAGSSNVQRLKSLSYTSTSLATGNTLTVSQGSLSLTKNTGYANQSIIAPQTAYKIGSFVLSAGTTEDLNLNTINLMFVDGVGTNSSTTESKISDVYIVYGPKSTNIKSTISTSTVNSYSVNYTLAKGQSIDVAVYATLASDIGASDTIIPKLSFVGQTAQSSQTVTIPTSNYTPGQTISMTTGTLYASAYAVAASSTVVAGNLVKAGSFKFTATGDTYVISELTGSTSLTAAGNVSAVVYKVNGSSINGNGTAIDTSDGTNAIATTTGLNIVVPANSSAGVVVDAYLQLATIGTPGGATSSTNVKFQLLGYERMSSTGVITKVGGSPLSGNDQYAYASVPTITTVDLPSTTLTGGTQTIARVSIAADAAGAIDWGMITFSVVKSASTFYMSTSTAKDLSGWSFTDDAGNAIAGTFSSSSGNLAVTGNTGDIIFKPTNIETISAGGSKTYRLKVNIGGTFTAGDNVQTNIGTTSSRHIQSTTFTLATSTSVFTWSDNSYSPHSVTSPDWNNDVLVKNLPTDTQSLTY